MLSLTRKTDYALIALCHLASESDRLASAREIADLYHITVPVLTNILKALNRADMVESVRGSKGGYRLARDPAEITLGAVIVAIEGPVRLVQCSAVPRSADTSSCDLMAWCPVRSPALKVHDMLQRFLENVTLGEIVEESQGCGSSRRVRFEELVHDASVPGQ